MLTFKWLKRLIACNVATAERKVYFFVNRTFNEVWKFPKMFYQ